jgi:hypothetical protein
MNLLIIDMVHLRDNYNGIEHRHFAFTSWSTLFTLQVVVFKRATPAGVKSKRLPPAFTTRLDKGSLATIEFVSTSFTLIGAKSAVDKTPVGVGSTLELTRK